MTWHPLSKEEKRKEKKKKKKRMVSADFGTTGKMVFTSLVSREYCSRRLSFRSTLKISKRDSSC